MPSTFMRLELIQVEAEADERGDEIPRRLCIGGEWVEAGEILDRWYQGSGDPEWPESDYFKIIGYDFLEYLLKHDRETGRWYLVQSG